MPAALRCGRFALPRDRPLVMGIVNVTPDSFFDGGRHEDTAAAVAHARRLVEAGADIVDVGGESSRPGATRVSVEEELARVLPVGGGLAGLAVPIPRDTTRPEVLRGALARGAGMVHDLTALGPPGAIEMVAGSDAAVCLMHMQGEPGTMQDNPVYTDVLGEVCAFLAGRAAACIGAGIPPERIVVDPGFSFGKKTAHNLRLLAHLKTIAALGYPVLVGLSRKSSLGRVTGETPADRLPASVAGALLAVQRRAAIVRAHDVEAARHMLAVLPAVE